ncbi:MAG: CHAT domain-containing protein [bacterium]
MKEIDFSKDYIEDLVSELLTFLNSAVDDLLKNAKDNSQSTISCKDEKYLLDVKRNYGKLLYENILDKEIKKKLKQLPSNNLLLSLDDELAYIPCELFFDGESFLGEAFNIGRQIITKSTSSALRVLPSLNYPLNMLIIADPTDGLPSARAEAERIKNRFCAQKGLIKVSMYQGEGCVNIDFLKENFSKYDVIHYAGHIYYDPVQPYTSGWELADGIVSPEIIAQIAHCHTNMPYLIFCNGCHSGYTLDIDSMQHNKGIAHAFLTAGVQHYIGTICNVYEGDMALYFYEFLLQGSSIGESLRKARETNKAKLDSVFYTLYGNPSKVYFQYLIDIAQYQNYLLDYVKDFNHDQYIDLDVDYTPSNPSIGGCSGACETISLKKSLRCHPRLVIIGDTGAGKTFFLHLVIKEFAEKPNSFASLFTEDFLTSQGFDTPPCTLTMYFELSRYKEESDQVRASTNRFPFPLAHIMNLINEILCISGASDLTLSYEDVHRILSTCHILFLFDGLNELPSQMRESCLQAINDLSQKYPHNRYIITTRPHNFKAPSGWGIVKLRELTDSQLDEFIECCIDVERRHIIQHIIADYNYWDHLPHLPLFLKYIEKIVDNQPDTKAFKSKVSIIKEYADRLLMPLPPLKREHYRKILHHLAEKVQKEGDSIPLRDALEYVPLIPDKATHNQRAEEIINELCELGILTIDDGYIRFCNHTMQEYFFSGAFVSRWRGYRSRIGPLSKPLKRLLHAPRQEDTLAYVIASLSEEEKRKALLVVVKENPRLAFSWADTIAAENPDSDALKAFLKAIRKIILTILSPWRTPLDYNDAILCFAITLTAFLLTIRPIFMAPFSGTLLLKYIACQPYDRLAALLFNTGALCVTIYLVLSEVWLNKIGNIRLIAIFSSIVNIRDSNLREHIKSLAREVSQNPGLEDGAREFLLSIADIEPKSSIISFLKNTNSLYLSILMSGYADDSHVLPYLAGILDYDNVYSYLAFQSLTLRAERFQAEREHIQEIARDIWCAKRTSLKLNSLVQRFLRRSGECFHRGNEVLKKSVLRIVGAISIFLVLYIGENKFLYTSTLIFFIGRFIMSLLVWIDARRIGAHYIPGCRDISAWDPWQYWLLSFLAFPLFLPLYILFRGRIRKNARRMNGYNE